MAKVLGPGWLRGLLLVDLGLGQVADDALGLGLTLHRGGEISSNPAFIP